MVKATFDCGAPLCVEALPRCAPFRLPPQTWVSTSEAAQNLGRPLFRTQYREPKFSDIASSTSVQLTPRIGARPARLQETQAGPAQPRNLFLRRRRYELSNKML